MLLEVSETTTRRQTLDQVAADTTDVLMWRDEAQMLNLASFGPNEHQLLMQAGIEGLRDILDLDLEAFGARLPKGGGKLGMEPPSACGSKVGGIRRADTRGRVTEGPSPPTRQARIAS